MATTRELSDEEFDLLVNEDVRDAADDDVVRALRSPENVDRWATSLKRAKRNMEYQLTSHEAEKAERKARLNETGTRQQWLDYVAEKARWRANVIRVKKAVENKLDEATALQHQQTTDLYDAIVKHREELTATDEWSEADERLWGCIE